MKKLFVLIPVLVFLLTGYTYPQSDVYYIKGSGTLGQNVTVYFPYNPNYRFSVNGNEVINVYTSTATGYCGDYTVSFPTFNEPYYYPYSSSSRQTVTWSEITDYHLPNINSPSNHVGEVIIISAVLIFAVLILKR